MHLSLKIWGQNDFIFYSFYMIFKKICGALNLIIFLVSIILDDEEISTQNIELSRLTLTDLEKVDKHL